MEMESCGLISVLTRSKKSLLLHQGTGGLESSYHLQFHRGVCARDRLCDLCAPSSHAPLSLAPMSLLHPWPGRGGNQDPYFRAHILGQGGRPGNEMRRIVDEVVLSAREKTELSM